MLFTPHVQAVETKSATNQAHLFLNMGEAERDYYGKSFSYALFILEDDKTYEWRTAESEGKIRVGKKFKGKSGVQCRSFSELFTIHRQPGQNTGFGCKRGGREGWCKLKEGDLLSCALEPPNGFFETLLDGAGSKARGYKNKAESSFWDWLPF